MSAQPADEALQTPTPSPRAKTRATSSTRSAKSHATLVGQRPAPLRRPNLNQAQERTEFLISALGSGAQLAALLNVNRSQPTQWRKGVESPSPEVGRLIIDLDHVVARAAMLWSIDNVMSWLTSANSFLNGASPLDVLRERGSREVVEALDAEQAGSYA